MTYAQILNHLRRHTRESCKWRGHDMPPFQRFEGFWNCPRLQYSECRRCNMQVIVNARPTPNEIDIGGEAVALNCTS